MMMDNVILISRCVKRQEGLALFHFKGFLKGQYIRTTEVVVDATAATPLKGQEYYLELSRVEVREEILKGHLTKLMALERDLI